MQLCEAILSAFNDVDPNVLDGSMYDTFQAILNRAQTLDHVLGQKWTPSDIQLATLQQKQQTIITNGKENQVTTPEMVDAAAAATTVAPAVIAPAKLSAATPGKAAVQKKT